MSNNVIKLIKKTQIFQDLLDKEVEKILEGCSVAQFTRGNKILIKGEVQSDLLIILEGEVSLTRKDGTDIQLGAGSFFGELILLADDIVAADIVAYSDEVFILQLPFKHIHKQYQDNMRVYGVIMANIAKMLASRLKRAA